MIDFSKLAEAFGNLNESEVLGLINEIVQEKADVDSAIKACQDGLATVGERFESGEYFVGDLIFTGDLMTQVFDVLTPLLSGDTQGKLGKIIICTVKGDVHDIGKNIVKCMLSGAGFEVIDLGVDTPADAIIASLKESEAKILGLSGVLTLAIDSMKQTVDALIAENMRSDIKIIIGGAPVTAAYCEHVGADAWSLNAAQGVKICCNWAAS